MKFKIEKIFNPETGSHEIKFSGSFNEFDLDGLSLSRLDRLVVNTPPDNVSDVLLPLETIYRSWNERKK